VGIILLLLLLLVVKAVVVILVVVVAGKLPVSLCIGFSDSLERLLNCWQCN